MYSLKRIYDESSIDDGYRVLVDRLWPRGVSKERGAVDEWLKDIAPSPGLRVWFDHKPERFAEFSEKYREELEDNPAVTAIRRLKEEHDAVTLLYAAKDPEVNHARVLLDYLNEQN